jgi:hypothetical protein
MLTSLVYLSAILERFPIVTREPRAEAVTLLVLPPEPRTLPDIPRMKNFSEASTALPAAVEPDAARPPAPELAKPEPAPSTTTPISTELVVAKPIPPQMVENPAPIPAPPEPVVASAAPVAAPAVIEEPKPNPQPASQVSTEKVVAHDLKPAWDSATPTRATARDVAPAGPASLGRVQLSQLIDEQDGLAAGLAALPSADRLGLPRVSIRVNAEWLEALPKTQERLYFSITTPEADREVLAYLPASHSFNLERPERPLWQIHNGDRVPALAEVRAAAARWLGVSASLVGLYTWHPPVFEDALRMFVLERMQELRVHLGPRDVVTVRLASGSEGTVMNLEPLRADASQ